ILLLGKLRRDTYENSVDLTRNAAILPLQYQDYSHRHCPPKNTNKVIKYNDAENYTVGRLWLMRGLTIIVGTADWSTRYSRIR
ncbi:unnamed protein product, partial [Heterotrigona itama]